MRACLPSSFAFLRGSAMVMASDLSRTLRRSPGPPPKADDRRRRDAESRADSLGSGIGSDVMKPIAAPIVGGMITSTIHILILVGGSYARSTQRCIKLLFEYGCEHREFRPQNNKPLC